MPLSSDSLFSTALADAPLALRSALPFAPSLVAACCANRARRGPTGAVSGLATTSLTLPAVWLLCVPGPPERFPAEEGRLREGEECPARGWGCGGDCISPARGMDVGGGSWLTHAYRIFTTVRTVVGRYPSGPPERFPAEDELLGRQRSVQLECGGVVEITFRLLLGWMWGGLLF